MHKTRTRTEITNQDSSPRPMIKIKELSTGLCTLAILFLISSLPPVQAQAQTTANATGSTAPSRYSLADEVTLTGTVSSVFTKAAPGMIAGSHLLLATPSGPVDAALGRFGLPGDGPVSVAAGQQIEATGVMKTLQGRAVFLVRTVKVGDEVYSLRNQHGVPLSPQARQRASQNTGENGVAR